MSKKYLSIIIFVLLTTLYVLSAQAEDIPTYEVKYCDEMNSIIIGDQIAFQHGAAFDADYEEALAIRAVSEAYFLLDGEPLEPVYYEGMTSHGNGYYGDRARVNWEVTSGKHTIHAYWVIDGNREPGETCTFKASNTHAGRDIFKDGTGERLIIPAFEGEMTFPANTPFFLAHGWVFDLQDGDGRYINRSTLNVFVDENLIEPEKIIIVNIEDAFGPGEDRLLKLYLYNFPEGKTGAHQIKVEYWSACAYVNTECTDPMEPVLNELRSWLVNFE